MILYKQCKISLMRLSKEKVRKELDDLFTDSDRYCTQEDLSDMKYMECCIKETLRLYPSAPTIARTATEDIKLGMYNCCFSSHHFPARPIYLYFPFRRLRHSRGKQHDDCNLRSSPQPQQLSRPREVRPGKVLPRSVSTAPPF